MSKRKIRKFNIDGIEMQFSFSIFNEMFDDKVYRSKRKVGEIEEELAEAVFVEKSTVHTWRNGNSGPSDIEKIQSIAKYFNCEYLNFMTEVNSGDKKHMEYETTEVTESEKEAVNRMYLEMLDIIRIAEKVFDDTYLRCDVMKKYEDFPKLKDQEIDLYFETRIENLKRLLQNEIMVLSSKSYLYLEWMILDLSELCWIRKHSRISYNQNFEPDRTISYQKYNSNLNENQIRYNFRAIRNIFFARVKEFLHNENY